MLSSYPRAQQELRTLVTDLTPSYTASYSPTAAIRGGSTGRGAEDTVIRIESDPYYRELRRRIDAVDKVLAGISDDERTVISLVYWRGQKTLTGATMEIGKSQTACYCFVNGLLYKLAVELGEIRAA